MDAILYAVFLLSLNVYHEARGEPLAGQVMVCQTVPNRARGDYGKIESVIYEHKQFTWTADGGKHVTDYNAFMSCKTAVLLCLDERATGNNGGGVTHYHRADIMPYWASEMDLISQIGHHKFYRVHKK